MHCRLPYTAPPVHLKADMDGPLSNRGEKVNGARLGGVGQSPPRQDWVSGKILVAEQAPSARHTQAPLSPTTQSLDLVPVCSECTASPLVAPHHGWPSLFQIYGFGYFAQTLRL